MTTRRSLAALFCFVLLIAGPLAGRALVTAQAADASLVTIDRIFESSDFDLDRFGPARWLDSGDYTTLEPAADGRGDDIVKHDARTGAPTVLVPALRLTPKGAKAPLEVDDYQWSADLTRLLVYTNSQKVWRQKTRGDYWVLDLGTGALHQLGGDAKPATLMFAKFSPDGTRVAYVREHDLYVEPSGGGPITRLTTGGSSTLINGAFDWVYEEELADRDGFRWSPDGRSIAYWQLDSSGVGIFNLIDDTDSLYPTLTPIPYPKVGTANSAARIGIVPAAGGPTRWLDIPGDPRNHYLARMEWAAGSDEVVVQQLNRLQNTDLVMLGDRRTGKVRTVLAEKDPAWVEVVDDMAWLDGGKAFTWVSERDGWQHVYVVPRDGGAPRLVTRGDFDVVSVESIDEADGWLYYIASPDDPTERYLFRTRLDGTGAPERLTPADEAGTHRYTISPRAAYAFHTWSSFGVPPATDLVRLPDHRSLRTLAGNETARANVAKLQKRPVEFFRVDGGNGVMLDAYMMKPPGFDPSKKYPILFNVYGEPAGQTVVNGWGGRTYLWHLMLAQQGYIVASIDNEGTNSPRGRAWRKVVYRQIGILASKEQAHAVREILKRPYVDPARVGVWGWSGGGSMTLNLMFRSPEIYSTGMAVAPVPDQRLYDSIYQERYMGLPDDNEEGYRNGSPITFAGQLRGSLLVVHGSGDDNVHYQGTERLVNALVAANKPFQLMVYPNRTHAISEGPNTSRHLYELLTRYLKEHMPARP
jgi:dipeptidyl-peptidase-4